MLEMVAMAFDVINGAIVVVWLLGITLSGYEGKL